MMRIPNFEVYYIDVSIWYTDIMTSQTLHFWNSPDGAPPQAARLHDAMSNAAAPVWTLVAVCFPVQMPKISDPIFVCILQ